MSPLAQQISTLSVEERLQLVWDIWDSIAADPSNIPVNKEDLSEMERRLDEYERDGNKGDTWDVVRKRIQSKL